MKIADDVPKEEYFRLVSTIYMEETTDFLKNLEKDLKDTDFNLTIHEIHEAFYKSGINSPKITEFLTRLPIKYVTGNSSWQGMVVEFPGDKKELSTSSVGTPYLRKILYPIADLRRRIEKHEDIKLPCIYFIGERFSDVFLRKFYLLNRVFSHVIVLTDDIYQCYKRIFKPPITKLGDNNESWTQMKLCELMSSLKGLPMPVRKGMINACYISHEVPCSEGTENPERLDILGVDKADGSLIAFEIKGSSASRVEVENLFLQGLEHQHWLERNKMAIKLLFEKAARRYRKAGINTRKRVRLVLGFYDRRPPELFEEMRKHAENMDPHLKIEFVRLINKDSNVLLSTFK